MSDEWGPWIEHNGKCVPVVEGTFIHIVFDDGDEFIGIEGRCGTSAFGCKIIPDYGEPWGWIWDHPMCRSLGDRIIRYRIHKPRALALLKSIAKELEVEMA
ncbi:hypothetical protein GCM10011360_17690 [Primorskyibacter flagellatus]|uniref:Uncharacterized protein n=1 Tax=Primorskyibacter flagellatus TaxID=1387277 RepID=A0A917A6A1_9RHOB|nr:hypothetical protein [Primorskyibacter flagellatus]GGE30062.1 hypothetical protein GCM10011360_17690 [Primorskyibacter flagellatus]